MATAEAGTTWAGSNLDGEPALGAGGPAPEPVPEPVLATGEIQGNVLPGFATRFQAFLFVELLDPGGARDWLRSLPVTTLRDVLTLGPPVGTSPTPAWTNVALSHRGLLKITRDADRMMDMPFKQGLARRSALLGDPPSEAADGNCRNWVVGAPGQPGLDAVLIVGSDERRCLDAAVDALRRGLPPGVEIVMVQPGEDRQAPFVKHEPFGFRDDISQPGVRGRLSQAHDGFLTPRMNPADPHQGRPGQNLIWPGEFVFGYPGQDPLDKHRPGPVTGGGPPWTRDGSLLVVRRLRQDVDGFHRFLRGAAEELSSRHPALAGLTPEQLGAKLMGRWPSGAPLAKAPDADRPGLGEDPHANNDFAFAAPTPGASTAGASSARASTAGGSAGDPLGLFCPRAAHIRRAYPRGAATAGLTAANIETHRMIRRSIAFGAGAGDGPAAERGIVFLAYQTSIERQFEFVTRAWLNNPHLHDTDDGHDPIAGQPFGAHGNRARTFTIPVRTQDGAVERVPLAIPFEWVVPTGGGYFFAPSAGMLQGLA
jgi:Dyp-type peroxidase family